MPAYVTSDGLRFYFSLICEAAVQEVYFITWSNICFIVPHFTCCVEQPCIIDNEFDIFFSIPLKVELKGTKHTVRQKSRYFSLT